MNGIVKVMQSKCSRRDHGCRTFITLTMFISMGAAVLQAHADEIGVEMGINASYYKPWYSDESSFQKVSVADPLSIFYRKDLVSLFGFYSAIGLTRMVTAATTQSTWIDFSTGTIRSGDGVDYIRSASYLALQWYPSFRYQIDRIVIEAHAGPAAQVYLNESVGWENRDKSTDRDDGRSPVVLVMGGAVSAGYAVNRQITAGLRSGISRTITNLYRDMDPDYEMFFFNWHNAAYIEFSF